MGAARGAAGGRGGRPGAGAGAGTRGGLRGGGRPRRGPHLVGEVLGRAHQVVLAHGGGGGLDSLARSAPGPSAPAPAAASTGSAPRPASLLVGGSGGCHVGQALKGPRRRARPGRALKGPRAALESPPPAFRPGCPQAPPAAFLRSRPPGPAHRALYGSQARGPTCPGLARSPSGESPGVRQIRPGPSVAPGWGDGCSAARGPYRACSVEGPTAGSGLGRPPPACGGRGSGSVPSRHYGKVPGARLSPGGRRGQHGADGRGEPEAWASCHHSSPLLT